MLRILLATRPATAAEFAPHLRAALSAAGIAADLSADHAPAQVDYIVYAPDSGLTDFTPFTACKAVLSLWAGVERIVGNASLTQPLCRMVDPGLRQGMVEYVTGHALRLHLGMDAHLRAAPGHWDQRVPPLAQARPVGILGAGELGRACAQALAGLGFPVTVWSRSGTPVPGAQAQSGADGLARTLAQAQILVVLLPLTPATANLLDAARLAMLPRGAAIINAGRGALIDDDALLAALDRGDLGQATLDVFRVEPLPADHRFWHHPRVTVTPHVAADSRPETASAVVADNIRRSESGLPLLHRVDRALGY